MLRDVIFLGDLPTQRDRLYAAKLLLILSVLQLNYDIKMYF
jgi:hypothetical protein